MATPISFGVSGRKTLAHEDGIWSVAWSSKNQIISGSVDEVVSVWDINDYQEKVESKDDKNNKKDEDQMKQKDKYELKKKKSFNDHYLGVISTGVSQNGEWAVASTLNGQIKFWNLSGEEEQNNEHEEESSQNVSPYCGENVTNDPGELWSCCLAGKNDSLLLSGSRKGVIHVYDTWNGLKKTTLKPSTSSSSSNGGMEDSSFVLSVAASSPVLFDEHQMDLDESMPTSNEMICAGGCENGSVVCYDLNTEQVVARFAETKAHHLPVRALCFAKSDSNILISGSDDSTMKLYDLRMKTPIGSVAGHCSWVLSVATSFDSRYFVSGSSDHTIQVFDLGCRECVYSYEVPDQVWSVAFSPNSHQFVAGVDDGKCYFFNTETKESAWTLSPEILGIDFSKQASQYKDLSPIIKTKIQNFNENHEKNGDFAGEDEKSQEVVMANIHVKPQAPWVVKPSLKHQGKYYFYNTETKLSKWSLTSKLIEGEKENCGTILTAKATSEPLVKKRMTFPLRLQHQLSSRRSVLFPSSFSNSVDSFLHSPSRLTPWGRRNSPSKVYPSPSTSPSFVSRLSSIKFSTEQQINAEDDDEAMKCDILENFHEKAKFEVLSGLGIGGFSTVVKVKNVYNNKTYAMKVISKNYKNQIDNKIKSFQIQLMDELKIMKNRKLNQSLFLQKCYYSFESNNNVFFVLDLYEGKDLFYHLIKNKKDTFKDGFQEDKVKLILAELYLAISHLHACGYIHRDLKIENIMVNNDGHIKLIDFGLAVEFKHQIQPMSAMGSLVYMAPELIRDKTGGRHTDWWSYGVLAHELITGASPWTTYENYSQIKREIISTNTIQPVSKYICSKKLSGLIMSLLTRNVESRLGFHHDTEVKNHKFFKGIDWTKTAKLLSKPPFKRLHKAAEQEEEEDQIEDGNKSKNLNFSFRTSQKVTPTPRTSQKVASSTQERNFLRLQSMEAEEDQEEALISYFNLLSQDNADMGFGNHCSGPNDLENSNLWFLGMKEANEYL